METSLPVSIKEKLAAEVREHPYATASALTVAALVLSALLNRSLAAKAERENPARGRFVEVDGVRLHYVERGKGTPLVLLHGNGSMIQDFETSGLIDMAAAKYRVIVFDRPGYGHSNRPRSTIWSPEAQADLIDRALQKIGAAPAVVLGHSWGASVAAALGVRHPGSVRALVLASGYYYPSLRPDAAALSGPAIPILGDILRYTLAPLVGRALWPRLMRKIFEPARMPESFAEGFPRGLALRPSQLRANAAEAALMVPAALAGRARYSTLKMPVAIVAGDEDRLIDADEQSERLHREVKHSVFHRVARAGHMVHQTAPLEVLRAIDQVAAATRGDLVGFTAAE
jgi:pimeloyl-ACP methyl ester carboxylesterase